MTILDRTLDPTSAAGAVGDWVCLRASGTVTRAVAAALTETGYVYGCLVAGGNPGGAVRVVVEGAVPASLSGLAALAGKARVNTTTARAERVASLSGSDYPIGDIDATGLVELANEPAALPTRALLSALTTPRHGAFVHVAEAAGHFAFSATDTTPVNGTTVRAADDGTRGRWTLTTYQPSVGDETWVPAGSTVATFNAAVQAAAALAASTGRKQTVRLEAGEYEFTASGVLASNVKIVGAGEGRTVLTLGAAGDPLLKTNAVLLAQGTLNTAKLNTTPTSAASGTSYYPPASQAISVTALGTVVAGDWFVYDGHNDPNFSEYYGGPGTLSRYQELLQVDSINSLTLRLKTHTLQYHTLTNGGSATPITIKGCDPVEGVVLEDLTLDGNGCANGLLCEYATDFALRRVTFKNFARFGVEWTTASVGLVMTECVAESCNSFVSSGLASGHRVSMYACRTTGSGARYLATGRIRGQVYLREHSAEWVLSGCDFSHVALPLHLQSSRNFTAIGCKFRDSDVDELLARDVTAGDDESRAEMGAGIDMGSVSLNYADWSIGTNIIGCVVEDARGGITEAGGSVSAVWLHDHRAMKLSGLRIVNTGHSPYAVIDGVTKPMLGLREQDCEYDAMDLSVVGCEYAWIRNSGQGDKKRGFHISIYPSSGTIPPNSILLKSDPTGYAKVQDLFVNGNIYFGATYGNSLSDYRALFDRVQFDDDFYTASLVIFKNLTGATRVAGEVVELDSTLTDGTVKTTNTTPSTGATAVATVAMPAGNTIGNNGFAFGAVGAGHKIVKFGTGEARPGMLLRAAGGGTHYADSTAAPGDGRIGMATSYKAAGSAGNVRAA